LNRKSLDYDQSQPSVLKNSTQIASALSKLQKTSEAVTTMKIPGVTQENNDDVPHLDQLDLVFPNIRAVKPPVNKSYNQSQPQSSKNEPGDQGQPQTDRKFEDYTEHDKESDRPEPQAPAQQAEKLEGGRKSRARDTREAITFVPVQWRPSTQAAKKHRTVRSSFATSPVIQHAWQQIKDNFDKLHGGEVSSVKDCPIYSKREDEKFSFAKRQLSHDTKERQRFDRNRLRQGLKTLCEGEFTDYNHHNPSIPYNSKKPTSKPLRNLRKAIRSSGIKGDQKSS
jgi:hypothetical protein